MSRPAKLHYFKGRMLTVTQICACTGFDEMSIRRRIAKKVELDAPDLVKRHLYNGQMLTVKQIAGRIGIHPNRVLGRLQEGKPLDCPRYQQIRKRV